MFGLMTKAEHNRALDRLRNRCERLQIDNVLLADERDQLAAKVADAEARKAKQLANLKQYQGAA